jgi:tetratricopeptide (TPR) repeat protein
MYFPSGYLLKPMALGHPLTLADFLWLRAIQYYGEHRMSDNRFPMAGHIFEVITELDPNFVEAYMFGGLVLAAEGGDLDRGLVLLRQGIAWNPQRWELPFWTGFVHYVSTRDNAQAARFFTRSSRLPGAPPYVKRFAAYTTTQVGDLAAALALWEDLLESSDHPAMRALAEQKAAEIRAQLAARAGEPS